MYLSKYQQLEILVDKMKKILQVLGCMFLLAGAASYGGEDTYVWRYIHSILLG